LILLFETRIETLHDTASVPGVLVCQGSPIFIEYRTEPPTKSTFVFSFEPFGADLIVALKIMSNTSEITFLLMLKRKANCEAPQTNTDLWTGPVCHPKKARHHNRWVMLTKKRDDLILPAFTIEEVIYGEKYAWKEYMSYCRLTSGGKTLNNLSWLTNRLRQFDSNTASSILSALVADPRNVGIRYRGAYKSLGNLHGLQENSERLPKDQSQRTNMPVQVPDPTADSLMASLQTNAGETSISGSQVSSSTPDREDTRSANAVDTVQSREAQGSEEVLEDAAPTSDLSMTSAPAVSSRLLHIV
jgi:hypothetical protein